MRTTGLSVPVPPVIPVPPVSPVVPARPVAHTSCHQLVEVPCAGRMRPELGMDVRIRQVSSETACNSTPVPPVLPAPPVIPVPPLTPDPPVVPVPPAVPEGPVFPS